MTKPELNDSSRAGIRPIVWLPIATIIAVSCIFSLKNRSERTGDGNSGNVGAPTKAVSTPAGASQLNPSPNPSTEAGRRSVHPGNTQIRTAMDRAIALEDRIAEALNHGSTSTRIRILAEVAVQLAEHDSDRALELVDQLLSNPRTAGAAQGFVRKMASEMANFSPAHAANWAETLPDPLKTTAFETTSNIWISNDIEGAAAWVATLADPDLRNSLNRRLGEEFKQAPPTPAAKAWAQNLASSEDGLTHVDAISRIWARDDVAGASDWATNLRERGARTTASVGIASVLATHDLNAARNWLQQLPQEERILDDVIGLLAYELDGKTPGAGLELARSFDHRYAKERESKLSRP